jgi:hypothetical protein
VQNTTHPLSLEPLPPCPDGPLTFEVRCRTRRGGKAVSHPVTINPDWTLSTPHEVELERIGAAMGGYLSCLELIDRDVPALEHLVQQRGRRQLPGLVRDATGSWGLRSPAAACACGERSFGSALHAADHARESKHVGRLFSADVARLGRLLTRVEEAYGHRFTTAPPTSRSAAAVLEGRNSLDQLWDSGVHPEIARWIHDAIWPDGPPMPIAFYLGVTCHQPSLDWLRATVTAIPDPDIATWASWSEAELDRQHPDARVAWLRAGVPRSAINCLADGSYSPNDIVELKRLSHRGIATAATTFAAWHRAACHPEARDVATLDELGVEYGYEPSVSAIDWLWRRTSTPRHGPTRTEVGLILAACGTRIAAMRVLEAGVRDPRLAVQIMNGAGMNHVHSPRVSAQ